MPCGFTVPSAPECLAALCQDSPSASGARGFNRGAIYRRDGALLASVAQKDFSPPLKRVRYVAPSLLFGAHAPRGATGVLVASVAQEGLIRPPLKRVNASAPSLFVLGRHARPGRDEYLWRLLHRQGLIRPPLKR